MSRTLELATELISCHSVSPDDAGCQNILVKILGNLGFNIEYLNFADVKNIWARRGDIEPLLLLLGHTDVVPVGNLELWQTDPFVATTKQDYVYGRGIADMKGGVAAMIVACENFIKKNPQHKGSIGFIFTSDEEAKAINGTAKVMEHLIENKIKINWCLVGEPTAREKVGDSIKNGRRGSLTGTIKIIGTQGHVAHPYRANNPIHKFVPLLHELLAIQWDNGNEHFPPTSLQISNINAGTGACNVIPADLTCVFNLRYSNELSPDSIMQRIADLIDKYKLTFELKWDIQGYPFLSSTGELLKSVQESILEITGLETILSTDGGTSDARFVVPTGAQIIELGLCNATIHGINECSKTEDLNILTSIYERIFEKLLLS